MKWTRRNFMGITAGALLAPAWTSGAVEAGKRWRVCVIGDTRQGGYGHDLHLAWSLREDVEVVALADPHEAGRQKHAEEAKAQGTYADYREMLEKERPDLVTIAPRITIHHRDYLMAAAECGAHGFMEKPLAVDMAEADEMIAAIDAKGLRWSIAFNFRTAPLVRHVRRMIMEEGLIGALIEMRGRGKEDHRAGAEDLVVLGTHTFDMMRYFAGDPEWCMAHISMDGKPAVRGDIREATEALGPILGDAVRASYGFPNGVTGYFSSVKNPVRNSGRWGLDFYGSKGVVLLRMESNGAPNAVWLDDPSWSGLRKAAWKPLPDAPDTAYPSSSPVRYGPITGDLLNAIQEQRRPEVSLHDGAASLEMIIAAYAAHLAGGRVALPLADRKHPLG